MNSESRFMCKLYQLFLKYSKKHQSSASLNTGNLSENSSLLKERTLLAQSVKTENIRL